MQLSCCVVDGDLSDMDTVIQRMQNSPLTRWLWRMWQHEETGRVVLLPLWKNPGRRWYVVGWPE